MEVGPASPPRRVTVYRNDGAARRRGHLLAVPAASTWADFLRRAGEKLALGGPARRAFRARDGAELDDLDALRDEDALCVTEGEPYDCHEGVDEERIEDASSSSSWITLNVGGRRFTTSRANVTEREPRSMLARMFADDRGEMRPSARDARGAYLVDRSPRYFGPVLDYLRHGELVLDAGVNARGVLEEAKFYGIESMIPQLEALIQSETAKADDDAALTRRDVVSVLIRSTTHSDLRFQGVNLRRANLRKLDLRHINFKYACLAECNLNGANLSQCCLERADLSHSNMESAQLSGIKALCANMEGANMQGCNLESELPAMLEGANLKGANLEGSNMARVNLRVATLKNANLKNCDLRSADLAGADLENCNLSGSDLQYANLRGANLKNAVLELMLTPLHMSQTVR